MRIFINTICFLAFLVLFASCSGISMDKKIELASGDWVMAGGTSEQKNVSAYSLEPPLNLMWEHGLEGGVGPAGITTADAVVFVNALYGELITIDVSSGKKIGYVNFLGRDANSAPLILGRDVILAYAGDSKYSLASYDLYNGIINWRRNYGFVQTSPILKDGFVYFGNLKGVMYKVNVKNGKMKWKAKTFSPIHSTCAVSEGKVVFGNDRGEITCVDTADGSFLWTFKTGLPVISTPMIDSGMVYLGGDDSIYNAIRLSDGTIEWETNLHTKIIGGSTIYNDGVIFGTVDGNIYSLSKYTGEIIWKFTTKGTIESSPVISGKYVYCTSFDGHLYALDAATGNMVWNYRFENKSKTSPVIWKNYLFVAADEVLYGFTNKPIGNKK